MNWPLWLFVVVMVGLFAAFIRTRSAVFLPLAAVVAYFAFDLGLWDAVKYGFWTLVALAVIALLWMARKFVLVFGGLALSVVVLAALVGADYDFIDNDDKPASATSKKETSKKPSRNTDKKCDDTWKLQESDHGDNNRWMANGIREIREADTPEKAREATYVWLDQTKQDPELLAGATKYLLNRDVDPKTLVDGDCASDEAEKLIAELELALGEAEITPEDAPANAYNSGTDADGNVVAASHAGITGDRKAVKVVLKDGSTIWIMARCGNPVAHQPKAPPGPTDETPPNVCPYNPALPVDSPKCLKPKDPSQSVNNNPNVPEQVKKTQPSPDNQSEIDEGPTQPVDSPTGCNGPCPTSTTTSTPPSPPPTQAPPPDGDPNSDPTDPSDGEVSTD